MPFTFFKSKPSTISEGYAQYTGMQIAAGGGGPGSEKFTESKKTKFGFGQAKDDFLMDIGAKNKTIDYYARLDDRQKRSQEAMKKLMEKSNKKSNKKSKKGKQTKTDKKAEEKKEAMAKLREEGRQRRIKFYKDKDMKFLNLRRSFGLDKEESTA